MPAVSKAQRRFFGMCEHHGGANCPKGMSKAQMHDFAATKEKYLPERKRTKRRGKHSSMHKLMSS
jgi:hypothetical protein